MNTDVPRRPNRLTIQARIALLVIACILPAMLLASLVTYLSYERERSNIGQHTLATTRELMRLVERVLGADEAAMQTLALSNTIDRGDFAAFYIRAQEALRYTSGFTFVLSDASGQQVVNLLKPFGSPLPRHGNPELLRRVLDTQKPAVSDLFIGAVTGKPVLAIEVPVIRGGKPLYGLALGIEPRHIADLLKRQGLPPEWVVSIFDSTGSIVARSHAGEDYVGRKGAPALMRAMQQASEGIIVTPTLEGIPVMAVYAGSPAYGWSVAVGVPEAILTADLRRWLSLYAIGGTLFLLAGLGLAVVIGRNIARPIQSLVNPALDIGKGKPILISRLPVKEADEVGQALLQAQQLLQQREMERASAEQANKEKAAFLANMSHQLRTPLNAILGFSRLMRNAADVSVEQKRYLDIIGNSGEHLLRLINSVLDLSRIESGRVGLDETSFDLHALLHEIHSLMHVQAAEKGLGFHLILAPEVPRFVTADADKIRQVLINLLGNAIKFTATGEVRLKAEPVGQESAQTARVRFEVEDSGPGIHDRDRNRVFSQFEQLSDAAGSGIGTGLGLHISKQHVQLMGGEIGFSTKPGKGSVFHFELPLRTTESASAILTEPDRRRITGLVSERQRFRLLIVDDEPQNRLLLQKLLEPLGFDLREAADGKEAMALFQQWRPHLIWMDICLPDIDGLQVTRQIRASEAGASTKIVALTARALKHERTEILAAGCDNFISKPYRETEIFDALEKDLGVQFVYSDEQSSMAVARNGELSVAQLEKLPANLLDALRDAAVQLDTQRCFALVDNVEHIDGELSASLRRMVENLQYTEMLLVLDRAVAMRST